MLKQVHKHILTGRIARLQGHIETVGPSPKFEEALAQAEAELREVEQRERNEQPGQ